MLRKQNKLALLAIVTLSLAACDGGSNGQGEKQEPAAAKATTPLLGNCSFDLAANNESFDIAILNGRVMDPECKFDGVRNVGIKGGKIVSITKDKITGKETVDAAGHVVTAGFIDTHTHSSDKYTIKMSMMDGVTSGMDYELGGLNIGAWYDREAGKWPINYGQCVAHEMVRISVHDGIEIKKPVDAVDAFILRAESAKDGAEGWANTVSNLDQINQITKRLDENLRQGALCVGTTPGYAPKGISTYELFEVQRAAARYNRPIASHTRFHGGTKPPTEAQLGFAEIFANAVVLKAPLLYSHNNDYGWWEIEEKLKMAREMGMNMWAEYYPYEAASTAIGAVPIQPQFIEDIMGLKYKDILYDPSQDKYLDKQEYLKIAKEDPGRTIVIFNPARKKWLPMWLRVQNMVVASDSMWQNEGLGWDDDPAKFKGHPRTSGSHTIVLRLGREQNVPLMHTLSQLSYWSAYHLGKTGLKSMQVRGRLQPGMAADIVVFDPKTVAEGSSYKAGENGLPPKGLPHVIVNGQFVKKDNKATNIMAGLPIRYPVEDKGRFVEATQEQWEEEMIIDDSSIKPRK
jgi:N-acyl-D-glutamate deacylase